MLLWIIKCRVIAGLLRPNLLFLVNSIKMSVRTPYSFTVGGRGLVPPVTVSHHLVDQKRESSPNVEIRPRYCRWDLGRESTQN